MILDVRIQFAKVVALDFYDGAVGGFAEVLDAAGNRGWFRYELVCWDKNHDRRVFCLADAAAAANIVADAAQPRWPLWALDIPAVIGDKLQQLRTESTHFVAIVLCDSYLKIISGVTPMTGDIEAKIPAELPDYDTEHFGDWAALALKTQ